MFEIILVAAAVAAAAVMEKSMQKIEKRERRAEAVRRVMALFDTRCQCMRILEDPLLGMAKGNEK